MSVVLCTPQLMSRIRLILCHRYRHPVADGVTTDDETAGMDTRTAHRTLQHLGIHNGIAQPFIVRHLGIAELGYALDRIGQIHLQTIGQTVRNLLTQMVHHIQRYFLHTRHILDGVLGGHRTIGDDMCALVVPIFILHPFQHPTSTIIVEVGIDIRE